MKSKSLALASCLLFGTAQGLSNRVTVPQTNISFELPSGFVPMPAEVVKLKYSRGAAPPAQVYSTPGPHWAVNIAFSCRQVNLPPTLSELQNLLEGSVQGAAGFRWEKHGIQKLGGRDWVVMQFWVDGLDAPIYNDLRATNDQGALLMVTANVTKGLYPKYAQTLKGALDSLR